MVYIELLSGTITCHLFGETMIGGEKLKTLLDKVVNGTDTPADREDIMLLSG
ncbi:hypothetical protein M0R04_07920 [Candidatus Dojkabacteria bacterium]|jgi:hypothetical protein|nr:hypothetical protein [Candidatus Dojkabacteria bacterium]